jgi:hypothetical protein
LGLGKEFVNANSALSQIGIEVPATEAEGVPSRPSRKKRRKEGLPMPVMPGGEEGSE